MPKRNLLLASLLAASIFLPGSVPQAAARGDLSETIAINVGGPTTSFPHFWEHLFGSGRAILSLRESYRDDLKRVKSKLDCRYVRFHGIFHDEAGLYDEDKDGKPIYNFSYIDQIYDGLLANGVRPFVELSFMPNKLAAAPKLFGFWYHPNVSPPKSDERWADMISEFTKHLISRYGTEEVSSWYFEVWNEPNIDFWAGQPHEETYYHLYDVTAKAIKAVNAKLRVGGPSTAQAAWADRFIAHCVKDNIPVDFVSTHVYGNDTSKDVFAREAIIPRRDMVALAVKKVHDQVKASSLPNLPIIWSEYNASFFNEVPVTDAPFMGPWLANNIAMCDGLADEMSLWTFSDVFEEGGVVKRPFYGGFGMIAAGNIPKAAFNAMSMLHELGDKRLKLGSQSAIATVRPDGATAVAVWNYFAPEEEGAAKSVNLSFAGLKGTEKATLQIVDAKHGSALATWMAMGKPDFPTREQQEVLVQAATLSDPEPVAIEGGVVKLTLQPHALALVQVKE